MSTKSDAEQHSDDGVEYAVDGTEHSRDGYGNLRTLEEQREMLEEEEMLSQAARAPIEARKAMLRATNPVAFSIPEEVYKAAAEDPGSLSAEDRALILSRGDLAGRALVDPQSLTRAERYEILGWPAPEVIEPRLRAASRRSGFVVSTPAELYAKAEANGTATLMPEELQLAAWRFHDHDPGLPPFTSEVPGNGEAYNAVFKAEGLNLEVVGGVALEHLLAKQTELLGPLPQPAQIGQPVQPLSIADFFNQPNPFRIEWPFTSAVEVTQEPPGQGPPPAGLGVSGLPGAPPGQLQVQPQQQIGGSQGTGFGFGSGTPAVAGTAASAATGADTAPGPKEAGAIIDNIADAMMRMRHDYAIGKKMSFEDFFQSYDNVVRSLHGLSLRFTTSLPPDPLKPTRQWSLIPPPPRLHLGPNPFGLRLSHDGRSVVTVDLNKGDNDLHPNSTQAPPWTAWSTTIPHRMLDPKDIMVPFEEYVAAVQSWTEKEERARRDHQQQQNQEYPLFYNTPPYWPRGSSSKRGFNIYAESVRDSEAANAHPDGVLRYTREKWAAMTADEQAVYETLCEESRKQAWIDSFKHAARRRYLI